MLDKSKKKGRRSKVPIKGVRLYLNSRLSCGFNTALSVYALCGVACLYSLLGGFFGFFFGGGGGFKTIFTITGDQVT